jgi:hypothetical protein
MTMKVPLTAPGKGIYNNVFFFPKASEIAISLSLCPFFPLYSSSLNQTRLNTARKENA